MNRNIVSLLLLSLLLLASGCQRYYLAVYQESVDRESLASTYVGTPDPRQKDPPEGQRLIVEWQISQEILLQDPSVTLKVIYKDYSEKEMSFPIAFKTGHVCYDLLGEEYLKTKGILAYQAEIITADGKVYRTWTHQFWIKVIRLDEEDLETAK